MRNLKRALSVALASVMLLGMMVVGTSASFPDVKTTDNVEAINVAQMLGIMVGDDKGNFNPEAPVTRQEMAVVLCNLLDLKATDFAGTNPFTDVDAWASNYVAACYANKIVSGTSATTFNGKGTVTAAEAALMAMKTLGYFQYSSDFGDDWKVATVKQSSKIALLKDVSSASDAPLTRNNVAQLILNALKADVVDAYGQDGVKVEGDGFTVTTGSTITYIAETNTTADDYRVVVGDKDTKQQLVEKLFDTDMKLDSNGTDDFNRPASVWTYKVNDSITAAKAADVTFTSKPSAANLAKALKGYTLGGVKITETATTSNAITGADVNVVTVGASKVVTPDSTNVVAASGKIVDALRAMTKKGVCVEIYADDNNAITDIIVLNYQIGEITKVSTNKDGDVTYTMGGTAYVNYADEDKDDTVAINGTVAKDDFVTYVKVDSKAYIYATTVVEGAQSAKNQDGDITVSGTVYKQQANADTSEFNNSTDTAKYFIDQYGYVIKTDSIAASSDYAYVVSVNGKLSTTIDGKTPTVEARVVLADGTVGVYEVKLEKITASGATKGDYTIKNIGTTVYDESEAANQTATTVTNAAAALTSGKVYNYSLSDGVITLKTVTALPDGAATDETTYLTTLTNVAKDKVSYVNSQGTPKTVLADKNTKFVVYNADKKTVAVYTGSANLPTAITALNQSGYAVMKASGTAIGTASLVYVSIDNALAADADSEYVYIDATKYTTTLDGDDTKYTYVGTYADGTKVTLAPGDQIGTGADNDKGIYVYDKDNKVDTTAKATAATTASIQNTYYIYDATLTVTGDLLGVTLGSETYYNITDDTQIVYINSDATEIDGNGGFVVLVSKDGVATSDVETIFITVKG